MHRRFNFLSCSGQSPSHDASTRSRCFFGENFLATSVKLRKLAMRRTEARKPASKHTTVGIGQLKVASVGRYPESSRQVRWEGGRARLGQRVAFGT